MSLLRLFQHTPNPETRPFPRVKDPNLAGIELPHGRRKSFELFWPLRKRPAGESLQILPHTRETLGVFLEELGEVVLSAGGDPDITGQGLR